MPDFVTAVTTAPVCFPYSASYAFVTTRNSATASTPAIDPPALLPPVLLASLTSAPSSRKLLDAARVPTTEKFLREAFRYKPSIRAPGFLKNGAGLKRHELEKASRVERNFTHLSLRDDGAHCGSRGFDQGKPIRDRYFLRRVAHL